MPINSPDEAIDFINKREKPLSMYLFTESKAVIDKFLNETSAGSVAGNDVVIQLTGNERLKHQPI